MGQGVDDFVVKYGDWIAICGVAAILGTFVAYQFRGIVERKERLRKRRSVSESEWFDAFYPVAPENRALVRDVLAAFAEEIGIEWTKLRPTDTFEDVLRVDGRYSPHDDLEEAELEIASLAEKLGFGDQGLPEFTGALRDFLDRWIGLCDGESPPEQATALHCQTMKDQKSS